MMFGTKPCATRSRFNQFLFLVRRAAFASWLLMNLLLVAVPRYGAYTMTLTGALLIGASIGYSMMLPKRPLTIFIEGGRISFRLSWCFWLVLVAGGTLTLRRQKEPDCRAGLGMFVRHRQSERYLFVMLFPPNNQHSSLTFSGSQFKNRTKPRQTNSRYLVSYGVWDSVVLKISLV